MLGVATVSMDRFGKLGLRSLDAEAVALSRSSEKRTRGCSLSGDAWPSIAAVGCVTLLPPVDGGGDPPILLSDSAMAMQQIPPRWPSFESWGWVEALAFRA